MIVRWKFEPGPPGEHTVPLSIGHGGRRRTCLLHAPPSLREGEAAPLVLAFHGTGGTGRGMEAVSGLSRLSDRRGFIVAYPDAVDRSWNDGRGMDHLPSHREGIDDVEFVVALVAEIRRARAVAPGRVGAAGISNGGFFCHYLAAKRADLVAAIAPVAAGMAPAVAADFGPSRPVSVLAIQGTEDPLIPYSGGDVKWYRGGALSAEASVRKWAERNGCGPDPRREEVPLEGPGEGMRARRETYSGGREGSEAELVTLEGGGHTWPGGMQFLPERIIGKTCRGVDASALIWDFFSRHFRA